MFHADLLTSSPLLAMLTPPMGIEYLAIIPGAIVSVLALIVILVDSFHRAGTRRDYLAHLSAVGLGGGILSTWMLWDRAIPAPVFHGMLYLDRFALFFAALACAAGALAILQAPAFLRHHRMDRGEFVMLILFSVIGVIFMANAADLLIVFLALEVMSIPVYCLAGFLRRDARSAESAMKYFFLGAFSAGLMLYGIAMIYGLTGTTNLEMISIKLAALISDPAAVTSGGMMLTVAVLLILSGFAFKVAAVPFHIWTPDVYTGAPSPGVGYMSTAVKAGGFAAMIRVFFVAFDHLNLRGGFFGLGWVDVFLFLAVASFVLGNVVAIAQDNVKRMLAYSSIAHAGYLLVGFVAAGARPEFFMANEAVLFYLATYTFGSIGAFGVLSYLGKNGRTIETYDDLSGLGLKYPLAGVLMGVFMFSSAGVPPTAGFVAKLYVFKAAVDAGAATNEFAFFGMVIAAVLTSVAGAYYYLRVLICMYMRPAPERDNFEPAQDRGILVSLTLCALMVLGTGVAPGGLMKLSREAMLGFQGASAQVKPTIEAKTAETKALFAPKADKE